MPSADHPASLLPGLEHRLMQTDGLLQNVLDSLHRYYKPGKTILFVRFILKRIGQILQKLYLVTSRPLVYTYANNIMCLLNQLTHYFLSSKISIARNKVNVIWLALQNIKYCQLDFTYSV